MTDCLKYQIAISLIKGIGPKLARNLIAYVGNEQDVFKQSVSSLLKIPGIGSITASAIRKSDVIERAEKELEFIDKHAIDAHFFTSESFPKRLAYCEDAPLLIYTKGVNCWDRTKVIGVVGTRKASEQAKINCETLVADIAKRYSDVVIVSGLAYGIDVCAHRAAVQNNLSTYGVLAHGLDRIYPSLHRNTAKQMLENGGLITEFMSDTNPDRPNFVRRNRIVAGMVDALLVLESGIKGGAIITARIAQSYNRDVLAFPGDVNAELSKGGNYLIKRNIAALIEGVDDLEYALGWESVAKTKPQQARLFNDFKSEEEEILYKLLLTSKELTANELSMQSSLPISKVSASMLSLEFAGLIKCLPGNAFRLL
ncbi:DNA-processing protein DprA [Carboxylicivirga sp. N1Y90]|uniref:DNA-processing protein DprA n=1 Tax=Carboxylicivirga fragile TaxID=3417571 RepID=UPI003D35980E|nr:DNA-processing protein DprA [Marinilabiliaceae bacterium N1Y90]